MKSLRSVRLKREKKLKRKGQLNNLFIAIAFLFVVILVIFIGKRIYMGFNDTSEGTILGTTNESKDIMDRFEDGAFQGMNNMYMIFFAGILIVMTVMAFATRTHPLFFPIAAFVVLPLAIFIAAIMSNAYYEFALQPEMAEPLANSTMPDLLMSKLPFYIFGYGVVLMIVLYGMNKSEGL